MRARDESVCPSGTDQTGLSGQPVGQQVDGAGQFLGQRLCGELGDQHPDDRSVKPQSSSGVALNRLKTIGPCLSMSARMVRQLCSLSLPQP